jgi:hypothetical protein
MISAGDDGVVQTAFATALETVAHQHNELAQTEHVDPTVRSYHSRPFQVLRADRFVEACLACVRDPYLQIAPLIGSVDQWIDSTGVIEHPQRVARALAFYE